MKNLLIAIACFLIAFLALIQIEGCVDPLPEREPADVGNIVALMEYHGTDVVYQRDGEWYFDRDGKRYKL